MSGQTPDELEIMLGGNHYRLNSPLQFTGLKTFPGKGVTGDYSLDSNPLLSSWVISDYTGGHGARDLNEATDTNRYSYGDINTRYPKQFTLPFQCEISQSGSSTHSYTPIGNMFVGGVQKYFSTLNKDLRADETSLGLTALTVDPQRRGGVAFTGTAATEMLYIPMGVSGYAVYDPTAVSVTNNATPRFKDFVIWDNKLVGIDNAGQLYYCTGAAGAWTSYGATAKLPVLHSTNFVLEAYVNASGDPAIHILSDGGVWIFDANGPKLYRTPIKLGRRPYVWSAFVVWRGDLYIGVGMDIIQWNGSVQRNLGLSRDDGIPFALQGRVIDLRAELNGLFALVQASDETGTFNGNLSVHEWSGYGWRALPMPLQGYNKAATQICVMESDSLGYKLVMGTQGFSSGAYNVSSANRVRWYLPQSFTAPRQALENGTIPFGLKGNAPFIITDNGSAYFETGRFDANMQGYIKLANELSVTFADGSTSNQAAEFWYRTESNASYTLLGTVPNSTAGRYLLKFGTADADGNYPGIPFQYIELKVVLYGGASQYTTPILQNMVMSFEKVIAQSYSWVANIDLAAPEKGRSPRVMLNEIKALAAQTDWFTMKHRDQSYRVQISAIDGQENLAKDERAIVRLSILQIPSSISLGVFDG